MAVIVYQIQQRHDTTANWTANNPILLKGEWGIDDDLHTAKLGDGTTHYLSLPVYGRGSDRNIQLMVTDPLGDTVVTGDGQAYYLVPTSMNGFVITEVIIGVTTPSTSGLPTVQIARARGGSTVDVLTTKASVDVGETNSYTAGAASVINTSNDDLATGDLLRVDVDIAGTGTKGLIVSIGVTG